MSIHIKMNNINPKNKFPKLRKKAEDRLKSNEIKPKKNSLLHLEHEVHVHEVELEMQNEELQATQLKLVKTIENYAELFDLAPVGYFILDNNSVIDNVNLKGSNLIGVDKKQLIGKSFSVFLNGESHQDEYYRHKNLVVETNELKQLVTEIRKKDGTNTSVLIESICVNDEQGNFKHILSTISDISKQIQYERKVELALAKEQELSEMKSRFISMATHEFRTPLSTILSSAGLIESYDRTEDLAKRNRHINKIKSSVEGLKKILTTFFTFNQLERNLLNNNPETFNLIKLIEDTISLIDTQSHILVYKHTEGLHDVFLDSKLLKICLTGILSNAVKHSPNDGTIEITTKKTFHGDVEISIRDYGVGIPESEKLHVFGEFFNSNNTDVVTGTGMGLSVIQKLIILMGGIISFESKINEGTVFVIKFPGQKKVLVKKKKRGG